jgi:hypothetical protein
LINSFEIRFSDNELSTNPFVISIANFDYYPTEIQTEILDLHNHSALHSKYREVISAPTSQKLSFWKFLPSSDFPNLRNLALQYSCKFGSTYILEQAFSVINIIKIKFQSKLSDDHLKNLIACANVEPNTEQIKSLQIQSLRVVWEWPTGEGLPMSVCYVIFILNL